MILLDIIMPDMDGFENCRRLKEKVAGLERMNDLFVGREFRMKELRDKIKELEKR